MAYEMTPFEKEMEEKLLDMRSELLHKIAKSDDDFRSLVTQPEVEIVLTWLVMI